MVSCKWRGNPRHGLNSSLLSFHKRVLDAMIMLLTDITMVQLGAVLWGEAQFRCYGNSFQFPLTFLLSLICVRYGTYDLPINLDSWSLPLNPELGVVFESLPWLYIAASLRNKVKMLRQYVTECEIIYACRLVIILCSQRWKSGLQLRIDMKSLL